MLWFNLGAFETVGNVQHVSLEEKTCKHIKTYILLLSTNFKNICVYNII